MVKGTFTILHNEPQLIKITMGNLLYTIAVVLVIIWAFGYFSFHAGGIIHILLVIALIAVLFRVIRGNKIL